jgi:hypothetical protein
MYAEGHALLLGQQVNGTVVYENPQSRTPSLGVCWRLTDSWHDGADQCNIATSTTAPGVQNDFTYAVWEWLFNECASATGFVNYQRSGTPYSGECNEAGFIAFLSKVNTLYIDTQFNKDPNLYVPRALEEFAKWSWGDGSPNRYRYGICPCTWGNVAYETPEQVPTGLNPERASARRNDGRPYNNGNSFSYFAWELTHAPNPNYRYFKVY